MCTTGALLRNIYIYMCTTGALLRNIYKLYTFQYQFSKWTVYMYKNGYSQVYSQVYLYIFQKKKLREKKTHQICSSALFCFQRVTSQRVI